MKKSIFLLVVISLFLPLFSFATIGVGVLTGKIVVDQELKPGVIYNLPDLVVSNSGDEVSDYSVTIQHREKQPELRPAKEWFDFEPKKFNLEPGKTQVVHIRLTLPVTGAKPGDYFALVQAYPVKNAVETAGATISVAAAAKLYFTVSNGNIFIASYYRVVSFFETYSPWSFIGGGVILLIILILLLRHFVSFNIGVKVKKK
ncbi:MAG: hypothetical protein QG603_589 [Patescibacteria group bacterium]|nr:hypothetical protein [Patescibacteria group bacterium]MDQ5970812.1 hypothetical protein [Patescibacteria group bacterium]